MVRWNKVIRDIFGNKSRTALVVLAIAVGIFAFGSSLIARIVLGTDLQEGYQNTNPATVTASMGGFEGDLIRTVRTFDGVYQAEAFTSFTGETLIQRPTGTEEWIAIALSSTPDLEDFQINRVTIEEGEWPPARREVFLERTSLEVSGKQIGDTITIELVDGTLQDLIIAGTVHDYNSPPATLFPQLNGYTTIDTLKWLGHSGTFDEIRIVTDPEITDPEEIRQIGVDVQERLERYGYFVFQVDVNEDGSHWAGEIIDPLLLVLTVIGILAMILSSFLVVNTITAMLSQQKRQIGMMKAVGAKNGQIVAIYLVMALFFGILAFLVALPVSAGIAYGMVTLVMGFLNAELLNFYVPPLVIGLELAIALIVPFFAALFPIVAGTRVSVREVISDYGISGLGGNGLIDRFVEWIILSLRSVSRPILLSLRNTFRRKGRLALTLITLTVAGMIFISIGNVRGSLFNELYTLLDMFGYDVQVILDDGYPVSKLERESARVEGVEKIEGWGFAQATHLLPDGSEGATFTILAPPADTAFMTPTMAEGRWIEPGDRDKIVVSTQVLRDAPQLKVGDTVELDFGDNIKRKVEIIGEVSLIGPPFAYADFEYITTLQGAPGYSFFMAVGTTEHTGEYQKDVARRLDERFQRAGIGISQSVAIDTIIGVQIQFFNFLVAFMIFMAIMLAVVGGLGLASTMSLNVLERTREIGVMRSIGAADRSLLGVFLIEGMIIGGLSWLFGVILSIPMSWLFSVELGKVFLDRPMAFSFEPLPVILWFIIALVVSALASYFPAKRASKVSVRESLSYE